MDNHEYAAGDDGCPYSWLNEWLCEYVDGTMDPSLQAVFEEYVEANPELAEHIEELRHTRQLLCQCRKEQRVSSDEVRARVQGQVEGEMLRSPRSFTGTVKEYPAVTVASSMVVALVIGMFAGAAWMGTLPPGEERTEPAAVRVERPPVPAQQTFEPTGTRMGVEYLHSATTLRALPLQTLFRWQTRSARTAAMSDSVAGAPGPEPARGIP